MKNVSGVTHARRRWRWLGKTLLGLVAVSALTSCLPKSGSEVESSFLGGIVVSKNQSHLTVSNSTLQPSDTSTVLITLLDQNGNAYISPKPLSINLSASGGTSNGTFSAITDNGDGTYTSTFTATHSGTATNIVASINGALLDEQPSIRVLSGTLSLSNSVVTVSALSVTSGSALTVTLTTMDTHNNAMGVGGSTVSFATSGGASTGSFSAVTDNGDGSYSATFTGLVSGAATTITCQIDGQSITSSLPSVTVNPGATTHFTLTGISSPLTAGSSQTLTVTAQDANGNTTPSYTGTVSFTTTSTSKTLPANYTFTSGAGLDNGVHSFAGVQLRTSGTQSITATDTVTASINGSISSLTVNPGSTSVLSVSGFTSPATSATSYSFSVTAQDAYGNTTPSYTGTVAFTSSAATKSLPANYTFTSGSGLDNGTHSFSGSITTAGTQSITATDTVTGSITGSQSSITVYPVASFSVASQDVAINQGTATVTVSLNTPAGTGQTVTVPITTNASSTAVNNTDYTLSTTSLSFSPGQSSKTITVTLIDQLSPATNNATITLDLGTLTNGVAGSTTSQTLTIRSPSLDLNFAAMYDPVTQMSQAPFNQITFTRASTATYTDCDGLIKTAATNVPRIDCNPITGQPKGLLFEPTSTNKVTNSANLGNTSAWGVANGLQSAASTSVAPDGTKSATLFTNSTSNGYTAQTITVANDATSWTCSAYLKAGTATASRLKIQFLGGSGAGYWVDFAWASHTFSSVSTGSTAFASNAGNGWYRLAVSAANDSTGNTSGGCIIKPDASASGSATAWGAQFENLAFPTSYIPTTSAAVTRSAEGGTIATLGSWFSATQGTLYTSFSADNYMTGQNVLTGFDDGTSNNFMWLRGYINSTHVGGVFVKDAGAVALDVQPGYSAATAERYSFAYQNNNTALAYNTSITTSSTATVPTVTQMRVGNSSQQTNATISRVSYYPYRLPDAVLQTQTNTANAFRSYNPTVNLTAASQTVIDAQGTVYVTAALSEPATATLTVPYTVGGTAVSGTNYSGLSSGNLTFAAGESRKTLSFSLLDDGGSTSPTITVTLSSGSGYSLGTNTTQTITIQRPALDLNFAAMYDPATQISQAPYNALTFTRSSTASYVDATGLIAYAATNVPRIDHDPNTHQPNGLLIEEARTNSLKQSGDLSNTTSSWTRILAPTVTGNTTISPDGTTTAATLTDSDATNGSYLRQAITVANSQTWTASVFILKDSVTTRFPILQISYQGGTAINHGLSLNTLTGAVTPAFTSTASNIGSQDVGNYWRVWVTGTNNATGNTTGLFVLYPAGAVVAGSLTGTATGSIVAWGAQLELGAFATSYIPTTSATATRAADNYSTSTLTWFNTTNGSFFTRGTTEYSTAATNFWPMWFSVWKTLNDRIELWVNSGTSNSIWMEATAGTATNLTNATINQGTVLNQAVAYNANDYVGTSGGTVQATSSTMPVPTGLTNFYLGSRATVYYLNGTESRLTYYPTRLANTQLQLLSSPALNTPRPSTPAVTLNKSSQSVLQSSGQAFFVVALTEVASSTITVPYTISGTAVSGTDYSGISSGTLTFTAGQSRAVASFTVNSTASTGRTVVMTLGSPTGATSGAITTETIYLTNSTSGLALTSSTVLNNGTTVTFSGTCGPGMTITISGTQSATTTCTSGGTWSWTSSTISTDGSYSFTFTESDGINTSGSVAGTYNRDTTAPTTVTSLTDGNYTTNATQSPTMTWPATTDPTVNSYNSGVSYYMLAIGTTAGGSDVVSWTNVGNVTSYQFTGLSLTNGTMYYGSIKAVDSAGNISSVTQGDGFAVVTNTPTLAFDFTTGSNRLTSSNTTYPAIIRFARATGANTTAGYYYNSSGILTLAPTNYQKYSQDFSQAAGWWYGTGATAAANAATAPDGTTTASLMTVTDAPLFGTSLGGHPSIVGTTTTYTWSVYAKPGPTPCLGNSVAIQTNLGGGTLVTNRATLDFSTGTASAGGGAGTYSLQSLPNGWYRLSVTVTDNNSGNTGITTYITPTFTQHDSCNIYLWGGQFEIGSSPTDYIYTTSAIAHGPRLDYNPSNCPSGNCVVRGLLIEGARTNIVSSASSTFSGASGGTVTANAAVAPDGTTTATRVIEDTANSRHYVGKGATLTAGGTYTYSAFLKAGARSKIWFCGGKGGSPYTRGCITADLSNGTYVNANSGSPSSATNQTVQALPNGWYRLAVTVVIDGTSTDGYMEINANNGSATTYTGDGASDFYVWGTQIEAGNTMSSYIPTTSATAVTRNADIANINEFSWLDANQGTLYSEYNFPAAISGTNQILLNLSGATRITPRLNAGVEYVDTPQTALFPGTPTTNQTNKTAIAYIINDYACALNGATPSTNTTNGVPTPTILEIGNIASSQFFFGWLQKVQYFNTRLTNSATRMITK